MADDKIFMKMIAPAKSKRVFLVDPFSIVRLTIAEWLRQAPGLVVCGQAEDEKGALEGIRRSKPDIVVTEILGQDDLRFVRTLDKQYPRLPILVFSFGDESWYAPRALEAGADGYLFKGIKAEGLVDGIRQALEGRVVLSQSMRSRLLLKCARRRWVAPPARKSCHGILRRSNEIKRIGGKRHDNYSRGGR